MNDYLKTTKARIDLAHKAMDNNMLGLAVSIYDDVVNDLMNMIKTLDTHIETMREIIKGEK